MGTDLQRVVGTLGLSLVCAAACGGIAQQATDIGQSGGAGHSGAAGLGGAGHSGAAGLGGAGLSGAGGDTCEHAYPNDPPTQATAGGALDLVFAWRSVRFAVGAGGGQSVGLDLDRTCTDSSVFSACERPSWISSSAEPPRDGPNGIDNAFRGFLDEFSAYVPAASAETWNANIAEGKWSVVLRVRDYNGETDDAQVEVGWYLPGSFSGGKPKFDGTDLWPITSNCLYSGDLNNPIAQDKKGYVSKGELVASFPTASLRPTDWMPLSLTRATLTGRLVQTASGWALQDGIVAGTWSLADVFSVLGTTTLVAGLALCLDSPVYAVVKKSLCGHVDIHHDPTLSVQTCDAISVGLGFEGAGAKLGAIVPPTETPTLCMPATDPYNDSCGK